MIAAGKQAAGGNAADPPGQEAVKAVLWRCEDDVSGSWDPRPHGTQILLSAVGKSV